MSFLGDSTAAEKKYGAREKERVGK